MLTNLNILWFISKVYLMELGKVIIKFGRNILTIRKTNLSFYVPTTKDRKYDARAM